MRNFHSIFQITAVLIVIVFLILSQSCKKKNSDADENHTVYRLQESIYFDNDNEKKKTEYYYENDLLTQSILYDSVENNQWIEEIKDEIQYPDENSIINITYIKHDSSWKPIYKEEMKFDNGRITEFTSYSMYIDNWVITSEKTYTYAESQLQQEFYTFYADTDFTLKQKFEYDYSGSTLNQATVYYFLDNKWNLFYEQEFTYHGSEPENILAYAFNSSDSSWLFYFKMEFEYNSGKMMNVNYYQYDIEHSIWNYEWREEFDYDEFGNVSMWNMIDIDYDQGERTLFNYEKGIGNVNQIYYHETFYGTYFWYPFPTKSCQKKGFPTLFPGIGNPFKIN